MACSTPPPSIRILTTTGEPSTSFCCGFTANSLVYWKLRSTCSALLWHRLMGRRVLSTNITGTNKIRAYAHCARESVSRFTLVPGPIPRLALLTQSPRDIGSLGLRSCWLISVATTAPLRFLSPLKLFTQQLSSSITITGLTEQDSTTFQGWGRRVSSPGKSTT